MEADKHDFLGPISSLCSHLIFSESYEGTSTITPKQLKKLRSKAMQGILFPGSKDYGGSDVSELAGLHAAWFCLARAGRLEPAARLVRLLERLGPAPAAETRAVLRLLLGLADPTLGRPPPPAPLGHFGATQCDTSLWDRAPVTYSTEYMLPAGSGRYTEFPAAVFVADADLRSADLPARDLFQRPPGDGVGCFGAPLHSQTGGPLGALVQSRSTAAADEKLRLPPLPSDPWRVPFAPETLTGYTPEQEQEHGRRDAAQRWLQLRPRRRGGSSLSSSSSCCCSSLSSGDWGWEAAGRLDWSHRGRRRYGREPPPISAAGPAVVPPLRLLLLHWSRVEAPRLRPVPRRTLLRHLGQMMMGLETASFPWFEVGEVFRPAGGLCVDGCSPEALAARCGAWVSAGSWCRRVAALAARPGGSLTRRAFVAAVEPCLRAYRGALLELSADTLCEFGVRVRPLMEVMALLADVCCVDRDSAMPERLALVSDLYGRLLAASEPAQWALLAHLFKNTVKPYLGFLTGWLTEGVCRDPMDEFPIRERPEISQNKDENFWTEGFEQVPQGTDNDHPSFVKALSDGVYQCGKTVSLLRLCDPGHPLSRPPADLRVRLAFSLTQLEEIKHKVVSYESEMQVHVANTLSNHLAERRRRHQELESAAAAHRLHAATAFNESLLSQRRRRAELKQALLVEQLRDMEAARASRRHLILLHLRDQQVADRQRAEDEINAERRENELRLARLEQFGSPEEVAALRAGLRSAGAAPDTAEPMTTSSDLTPGSEAAQQLSPGSPPAPPPRRNVQRSGVKTEQRDRDDNVEDIGRSGESGIKRDEGNSVTEKNANVVCDDETADSDTDKPARLEDTAEMSSTDAVNANVPSIGDSDENANTAPSSGGSHLTSEEAVTSDGSRVTSEKTQVTSEGSTLLSDDTKVTSHGSTAGSAPSEGSRVGSEVAAGRRRGSAEEAADQSAPSEPVLVDQIGGEVLRRRGRNVHGHATDSCIERLIYHGRREYQPEGPAPLPAPLPRRQVTVRSADSAVTFQEPDFTGDLLKPDRADGNTEDADDEDPSPVNQFSMAGTLQHSVTLMLNAQLSLVNASLLNHLLVDAGLMDHFIILRRFLLLADGEFGARLCSQLFRLVDTVRLPHQLLSPATLSAVLSEALAASGCGDHPLAERFSFVISTVPPVLNRSSPSVLTCLELDYRAGWPHCLVLTDKCLARYRAIFHLFLQLRRAVWALEQVFSLLKAAGESRCRSPQLQRLQLCRHEMQHFVLALQAYLSSQVLQVTWAELQRELTGTVQTFDDLCSAHTSYIGRAASRCLLNVKAEPIRKIVDDVFRIVLKFHAQLSAVQWQTVQGEVRHPSYAAVMKTHKQFTGYSTFLFKVVNKTKERFYQPHLNDLANRLNFNGFYTASDK